MLGMLLVLLGQVDLTDPSKPETEFSIRVSPLYRWISGTGQAREDPVPGTRLGLNEDLGVEQQAGVNVQVELDTRSVHALMEIEEAYGFGGTSTGDPFAWTGTVYDAPSQVRSHSSFLTLWTLVAFKLIPMDMLRSWIGPVVGLEYPNYTVSTGTNRQHGTTEEWSHYLPYPVVGAAGYLEIDKEFSLRPWVTVGYLPNVPTPFTEGGGRIEVSVRPSVNVEIPLVWRAGSSVDLTLSATFQYWSGWDHSDEEENRLTFWSTGLMAGASVRW